MAAERGKYIVIEGPDGTGKTTQADILQKYLEAKDIQVIHIKEPGGSPVSEAIRTVLLDSTLERTPMTNILLFTANRHELWQSVIQPALRSGTWVIATRNYWSTLAYQGYGEGMDASIISAVTSAFTSKAYMQPDFACILTLDNPTTGPQRVAQRGKLNTPDTFESKDSDFQQRVSEGYVAIAAAYDIPTICAQQSIAAVASEIATRIDAQ